MKTESVLSQWFRRVWNENDVSAIEKLAAHNAVAHGVLGDIHGIEQWKAAIHQPFLANFPTTHIHVLDEVIEGNKIFSRLLAEFSPAGGGEPVRMKGTCLVYVENGKIAEAWDCWALLELLEGLKLLPAASFQKALMGELAPHQAI